jgi:hypothetical protein
MKSIKPAARNRGRKSRLLLLPLLLLVSLHSQTAFSASLSVKIRQVNPDSEIQQVTCTDNTKCVLPIDIQTGATKETLTVHVLFVPGNVLFEFETPKGYLYAGEKNPADAEHAAYETIWTGGKAQSTASISPVTLFLPLVAQAAVAPILSTVEQPVADLEITTEAAP